MNISIIESKKRIDYYHYYFLIVPDIAAGKKNRYSIYRIPSSPGRPVKVVGRELDLKYAREYTNKLCKKFNK